MKQTLILTVFFSSCTSLFLQGKEPVMDKKPAIFKYQLDNGMTLLVRPERTLPKVSIQLWYNVGSKDEKTGEKGIAHLIEHMIFKGTTGKNSLNLAESDINIITHMLSGNCNAFTGHDYTGYLFNFPTHHWHYALPIMADCMRNSAFKDDHLDSEMKAVIQELKMRRDNYLLSLAEAVITSIFTEHPYHYPIIGYKQDLWNVHSDDLMQFYKKHYVPNNATLVIVGDVDPEDVLEQVTNYFGPIPSQEYAKEKFYINKDLASKTVTMYRVINQPAVLLAFLAPGSQAKKDHVLDILSWILGQGKGSRLYKKLVDELQLVTTLSTFVWNFFEHSLFFIHFEPKNIQDSETIIALIQEEIDALAKNGPTEQELARALRKARMNHYSTLESTQDQAHEIGKYFLATGDEYYSDIFLQESLPGIQKDIKKIVADFRPSIMHKGFLLPLPEQEVSSWLALQKESDELDAQILSARVRTTPLEEINHAKQITVHQPKVFKFPKAETFTLSNGIKVFAYHNPKTPKIDVILELRAKSYYDPIDQQGLYNFVTDLMTEGTESYSAAEFAHELESRGMSLAVTPGAITMSMLSTDLYKGLSLLKEILTHATFPEEEIEKVRSQLIAAINNFWDDPKAFAGQLVKEEVYKGHPYSKNSLGTLESIQSITRDDLVDFYEAYISPSGARLAIVGDINQATIKKTLEQELGAWKGAEVEQVQFPPLAPCEDKEVCYPINRDQVVLCFAGLSVERTDKDYDKLLIFDQILSGGALGSLSSRLFKLREQSGLFYTIGGSLVAQANEQPGMVMIRTLVSLDRLQEAEDAIRNELLHTADTIAAEEFEEAKNAILNSLIGNFESNQGIAATFLFVDKYGFSRDYFDKRAAMLNVITIDEVQRAVRKRLNENQVTIFKVGRVGKG